ncbi:MAG: SGNH/GDSL hydrolase family protein [Thermoguttaceae bacterium]|nr:SGNH/GDSL hydrolase family protein [Thermoguttaceae bacterium]
MKKTVSIFFVLIMFAASFASAEVFKDGQKVCFLGDSITHAGLFHYYLYDYYVTRFPEANITFFNRGVGGDTASGAMRRLDDDVFAEKPDIVALMFGMNDAGTGNYVLHPTSRQLELQKSMLEKHEKYMELLVSTINERLHPRFIFATPSPFDDTGINEVDNNHPGYNAGLVQCGKFAAELAKRYNAEIVDYNTPMTTLNARMQKVNPKSTIIGPDRIHPQGPGHLVMTWLFLKMQDAPSIVSLVDIDAIHKTGHAENASLEKLDSVGDKIRFRLLEKSLPMPIAEKARPALELIPFINDFNRQIVRVQGLKSGSHELFIDGKSVGTWTDKEFADGINLAMNEKTPQYAQSQKVAALAQKRQSAERVRCLNASCRWYLSGKQIDANDLVLVKKHYEEHKNTKNKFVGLFVGRLPNYLKTWPHREAIEQEIQTRSHEVRAAAIPVPHDYELR